MDVENRKIEKEVLHEILRNCRLPKQHRFASDFVRKLPHYVRIVWTSLATDLQLESDLWALYSRVAVIGMYYLNWYHSNDEDWSDDTFLTIILHCVYKREYRIIVRPTMDFHIRNRANFTAALIYGLMSLVAFKPGIYTKEQLSNIFSTILDQCRCHTRYTSTYFALLFNFVNVYTNSFSQNECIDLLRLAYNNVDRKDALLTLKAILTNSRRLDVKRLFDMIVNNVTWENKYKFVMLNELITTNHNLITFLNHDEFIKTIIKSQANSSLAAPAGKLYATLVEELPEKIWAEKYYPVILKFIEEEQDVDYYHKNTFKYILIRTFKHFHLYFSDILNRHFTPGTMPVYSILNLIKIIIDNKFDKTFNITYDFNQIMANSYLHPDAAVRTMFFYILTNQNFTEEKIFTIIKEFIVLNINDADNFSRDYIKKTYDLFVKNLIRTVIEVDGTSELKQRTIDLFNWLIRYLFTQFKPYCNYQRLAIAYQLILITFTSFRIIDKERRTNVLMQLDFFKNCNEYFDDLKNMLIYCNKDDSHSVINLSLEIIPHQNFKEIAKNLHTEGMENISSANIETSLRAERSVEFYLKSLWMQKQYIEHKNLLRVLVANISVQWLEIQKNLKEDVITQGVSFGAALNLVAKNLRQFSPVIVFSLIQLAESIVESLLEVFQIRAMIQYTGNSCIGIALAFAREDSPYHAVTVNTMWLALKAVCKLLLSLVNHLRNDYVVSRAITCLKNIINNCFHKGLLEVASLTLGAIIAFCTSTGQSISFIEACVVSLLNEIPCVIATRSTVRRFAEKRLILCSMVLSDKRPGKPLYHKAMAQLCFFLSSNHPRYTIDGRCLVLHCLQPLLIDTQVETHAAEYYERIVLSILNNFQNRSWNVRNAALQAFGAISNKLLGCSTISDGKTQRHAISVEELFYRYRNIYPVFIVQVKAGLNADLNFDLCKHLHPFTPIGCLLSMTYSRGEELFESDVSCITYITGQLIYLLKSRSHPEESILIARSFTAITNPKLIMKRIKLTIRDNVLKRNNFFGWIYLLKCLCDKLIMETSTLSENPKDFVLKTTDQIIKSLLENNRMEFTNDIRYAIFILYRTGVTSVNRKFIEHHFGFFCEKDPSKPYPQFWIDDLVVDILTEESIIDLANILKDLLFYEFPFELKILCFKTLNKRISMNDEDNEILSNNFGSWFITFLNHPDCWSIKIVSEECIKLILNLKITKIDETFSEAALEFMHNKGSLPDYFCTVIFVVYQTYAKWKPMNYSQELCLNCAQHNFNTLDSENPDILIIESVIYISKYAKKNDYTNFLIICLNLTYKLLQSNEYSLIKIGEKSFEILFNTKSTFTFANILYLIDNVQKIIGQHNALDFLGSKFWEKFQEESPLNAFEKKTVLKIHSSVLKDRIIHNFNKIYNDMSRNERVIYYNRVLKKTKN